MSNPQIGDKVEAVVGLRTDDGVAIMPGSRGYVIGFRGKDCIIEWAPTQTGFHPPEVLHVVSVPRRR